MLSLSFMAGSAFGVVLGYVAPLPLFLIGLGLGTAYGAVGGISGGILAGLLGVLVTSTSGMLTAAGFLLVNAVPAWLAVRQVLQSQAAPDGSIRWRSPGWALAGIAVFGTVCLVAIAFLTWGEGADLGAEVAAYLDQILRIMAPNLSEDQVGMLVRTVAPLFPGLVIAWWVVMLAANGVIAQSVLVRMGRNVRPSERLQDLRLPDWLSWLFVAAAAVALVAGGDVDYVARNALAVLAVPFLFLGLAVVHVLARRTPYPVPILVIFYFILVVSGWAAFGVAGIGMIEQWAGVRRRLAGPQSGQENEPWK